jgi:phosphoserine phosphatase RsbU/P
VSGPFVRRLRLPPDATSPAIARGTVASVLVDAHLITLRDEATLLTSELVTNGVIHARTEIELEVVADARGVHVAVTDFAPPPEIVEPVVNHVLVKEVLVPELVAPAREGGRGLLLVSRVASRWGTSHDRGGRTVWFHLDAAGARATRAPEGRDTREVPDLATVVRTLTALAPDSPRHPIRELEDLLARLGQALSAATATVTVDRADGEGLQVLGRYAPAEPSWNGGRSMHVPLTLAKPWTGQLTVTGALGEHAHAVATLTAGQLALLVEGQRQAEDHYDRRGWLLFLAEAGDLLAQSMNVELTVALIPRLVVPRLGLWCAVHMLNEYGDLTLEALTHADEAALPRLSAELEAEVEPLRDVLDGEGFAPLSRPTDGMAFPLSVRGERLGVLTIGRPPGRAHQAEELAILSDLSRRAASAIDNARVHDQRGRIATALQRSLLPPTLPIIDGLEVAAQYVPAGDGLDVGGDFYDLVPLPGGGWMLAVGDVSGKGAGAAAVTGLVREVLHTLVLDHRDPEHALERLNATLVERSGGYYCTLALAFFSPSSEGAAFDVSLLLAGHDQPVLLRADGSTSLFGECGTALGLLEKTVARRATVRLQPGDALVFYTDGVTERRRGRTLYGQKRLRNHISTLAGSPAAVLASQLRSAVLAFSPAHPRDDIAIVALRAL